MNSFSKKFFGTEAESLISMLQAGQARVSFETRSVEGHAVVSMKVEMA